MIIYGISLIFEIAFSRIFQNIFSYMIYAIMLFLKTYIIIVLTTKIIKMPIFWLLFSRFCWFLLLLPLCSRVLVVTVLTQQVISLWKRVSNICLAYSACYSSSEQSAVASSPFFKLILGWF